MRIFVLTLILTALFPLSAAAQWTGFPPDICCDSLKPTTKLVGPVRTVLEVERNVSMTIATTVITYDAKGRKVEELHHSAGNPPEAAPGKLIRLDYKLIFAYDSQGRLIQENAFHEDGSQYAISTYKYDNQGRLSEEISNVRGRVQSKRTYTYEPERQTITALATDYSDEKRPPRMRKTVFVFDEKEHSIRIVVTTGSTVDWGMLYNFDEKGSLIKQTRTESFKSTSVFAYKYDKYGNWIEREEHAPDEEKENSRPWPQAKAVTFRVITYHDEK